MSGEELIRGVEDLKEWIKRELVGDPAEELAKHKERVKNLLRLTPEGKVVIKKSNLPARSLVALYYIGAAYAKIGGLRDDDSVSNKEIVEVLNLPEGTVHPKVKELRDGRFITAVKDGWHRVDYTKIGELLDEAERAVT